VTTRHAAWGCCWLQSELATHVRWQALCGTNSRNNHSMPTTTCHMPSNHRMPVTDSSKRLTHLHGQDVVHLADAKGGGVTWECPHVLVGALHQGIRALHLLAGTIQHGPVL
jgi:hypothetical protein